MIDDAIKNVPYSLKEASFSLGADRWHTLSNVTLPSAISGISSALMLGHPDCHGGVDDCSIRYRFQVGNIPNPFLIF